MHDDNVNRGRGRRISIRYLHLLERSNVSETYLNSVISPSSVARDSRIVSDNVLLSTHDKTK